MFYDKRFEPSGLTAGQFLNGLCLAGCELRERTQCFVYSLMCVIDSNCEEGRIKEKRICCTEGGALVQKE